MQRGFGKKVPPVDSISCYKSPHSNVNVERIVRVSPQCHAGQYRQGNAKCFVFDCVIIPDYHEILCRTKRRQTAAYFHFMLCLAGTCSVTDIHPLISKLLIIFQYLVASSS